MHSYLNLLNHIRIHGDEKEDRTGTGTKSCFGLQFGHNLKQGFPLLTTKKLPFRWIVEELLWFLSGSTNVKDLQEKGVTIWDEWATKEQCAKFEREEGDLGPIYGALWRNYPVGDIYDSKKDNYEYVNGIGNCPLDQIALLINDLKSNPNSRRHIVTGWHPYWARKVALPPCHTLWQCNVANGWLDLHLYQRSADFFLGVPFNIASYALLCHMLANQCGYKPRNLICSYGDVHLYNNHRTAVSTQIRREPRKLPELIIKRKPKNIFSYSYEDFELVGYDPYPKISAKVAV